MEIGLQEKETNVVSLVKMAATPVPLQYTVLIGYEIKDLNSTETTSMFVCVEVLRPSQPNGVMSNAVSLPNHMFTEQA